MKTFNDTVVFLDTYGRPVSVSIRVKTGSNASDECGICRQAFNEVIRKIKELHGSSFITKESAILGAPKGSAFIVNSHVKDWQLALGTMFKKTMVELAEYADLDTITVSMEGKPDHTVKFNV